MGWRWAGEPRRSGKNGSSPVGTVEGRVALTVSLPPTPVVMRHCGVERLAAVPGVREAGG